ncbi:hypothetical protein BDN67DRAFT_863733, partial [Paxillus ammoniavirescens]
LEATGIRGCACAHHGCFMPHAVVDFQKGEWQVNMDYMLAHALSHNMTRVRQVLSFYDINCQYMKNLRKWLTGNVFIMIPPDMPIVLSISIWHVHGHQAEC